MNDVCFESRCKKALFINGKRVTDYLFDEILYGDTTAICIYKTYFIIYDCKGKKILGKSGSVFRRFQDKQTKIWYLILKSNNLYGAYTSKGEVIIPVENGKDYSTVYNYIKSNYNI